MKDGERLTRLEQTVERAAVKVDRVSENAGGLNRSVASNRLPPPVCGKNFRTTTLTRLPADAGLR